MCPSCGFIFETEGSIIPDHSPAPPTREVCAGSGQHARNPDTDRRFLWNGKPNPHLFAAADQFPPGPHTTTTHAPIVVDGIKRAFDPWTDTETTAMNAAGEQVPLVLADAQAETFKMEVVGQDWDGTFKPIDQLSYSLPAEALAKLAAEHAHRTFPFVSSRIHPDDIAARIVERPHIACSVCNAPLDYFNDGKHTGTPDGAGGYTCPECTRPPDAPHVVSSK